MRVAIIGGGVAGAAAACHLAARGLAPVVIERTPAAHDKVCGEFLSVEAVSYLGELGIDVGAMGAVAIEHLRLHRGRDVAAIALPFRAHSLSRRRLDEALLHRAAALGAVTRRGVAAKAIAADGVELASGERVAADRVLLATGKHELRGAARATERAGPIGFKMHFRFAAEAQARLGRSVEIFLFRGGYAGLEPIEDGSANLCLVVAPDIYAALGRGWDALIARIAADCPAFAERLSGAVRCWKAPLAVASIPYGYLHGAAPETQYYRIGDQVAVIPSFAGDGIAIALHSARRAAQAVTAGIPPVAFHRALRRELLPQMRRALRIERLHRSPLLQALIVPALRHFPGFALGAANRTRLAAADWRDISQPMALDRV
jgi:flavin-dependent dehydrogenase